MGSGSSMGSGSMWLFGHVNRYVGILWEDKRRRVYTRWWAYLQLTLKPV